MATCLACLLMTALLAASGSAASPKASGASAESRDAIKVNVLSPVGRVTSPFIHFHAEVSGDDTAAECIAAPESPCHLVSYVIFRVDGQYIAQDFEAPYSIGARYGGPSGRHTVTAEAWRDVQSDFNQPVLLGVGSQRFCLHHCGKRN